MFGYSARSRNIQVLLSDILSNPVWSHVVPVNVFWKNKSFKNVWDIVLKQENRAFIWHQLRILSQSIC